MNTLAVKTEIVQCKPRFDELLSRFIQYIDVSPSSVKSYISGVRKFIRYLSVNGINTPTRETVLTYKKELSEKYSANSTALFLSSIRRFFAWCESEGLYGNIAKDVKSPKLSHDHKRDAFSAEELKSIIGGIDRNSLSGKRDYAIFCLVSATGLRTVEVMRANVGDIHRVAGATVLDIQGKGHTSKDAFVKLSGHVLTAIREYLSARGAVSDDEPLFASLSRRNYGKRLTTRSVSQVCKNAMLEAGFDSHRLTAHSLRHSAVTLALLAGISIQEVSMFARHSSISVTQVYAHDISRLQSQCESAISTAIFGSLGGDEEC